MNITNAKAMPMLPSTPIDPLISADATDTNWPAMPTETEIYILPDGRIVIADLPAELAPLLAELGQTELSSLPTPEATADPVDDPYGN